VHNDTPNDVEWAATGHPYKSLGKEETQSLTFKYGRPPRIRVRTKDKRRQVIFLPSRNANSKYDVSLVFGIAQSSPLERLPQALPGAGHVRLGVRVHVHNDTPNDVEWGATGQSYNFLGKGKTQSLTFKNGPPPRIRVRTIDQRRQASFLPLRDADSNYDVSLVFTGKAQSSSLKRPKSSPLERINPADAGHISVKLCNNTQVDVTIRSRYVNMGPLPAHRTRTLTLLKGCANPLKVTQQRLGLEGIFVPPSHNDSEFTVSALLLLALRQKRDAEMKRRTQAKERTIAQLQGLAKQAKQQNDRQGHNAYAMEGRVYEKEYNDWVAMHEIHAPLAEQTLLQELLDGGGCCVIT